MEAIANRLRKRSGSTDKPKNEFELPKIKKTSFLLRDKENHANLQSFSRKFQWVDTNVDYSSMSDMQITEEFHKLKKELIAINAEVVKAIQKVSFKSIRKKKTISVAPTRTLEIRDKEIENNEAMLDRLRKQYLQLQKRQTLICVPDSKQSLDQQIQDIKKQCEKTKNKIRQMKLKNKSTGDSITNTSHIYEQIRRLEEENDAVAKKKSKLHHKNQHLYEQISTVELKLQQVTNDFTIAQNYFQEYESQIEQKEKQKEITWKLHQTEHNFQVLNKKNEIISNTKQQKYHAVLKTYENQVQKLETLHQKISSSQLQIINSKSQIQNYEAILRQSVLRGQELQDAQQEPTFFTEAKVNTLNSLEQKLQKKNTKSNSLKSRTQSNADDSEKLVEQTFKKKLKEEVKEKEEEQSKQQFGDEDDVIDEDQEIRQFKIKAKQEQWKRNSKEELDMHMYELNSQLKNINAIGQKGDKEIEEFK